MDVAADRPPPVTAEAKASSNDGWNRIVLPADRQGHFRTQIMINGTPIPFLVDSGATMIVLDPEDARRVGINPGQLRYTLAMRTANGVVRAAPVKLRELRLGQLSLSHVDAIVNEVPLGDALLGMGFLNRLEAWEVKDGKLSLYW